MSFNKIIIVMLIVLTIIFTAAVLWIFSYVGSEPMALVGAFFAFITGELAFMASIKKKKIKEIEEEEDDCDNDY